MKSISNYGNAIGFFFIVLFSILFMNIISAIMLIRLGSKKEEETYCENYLLPVANFAEAEAV